MNTPMTLEQLPPKGIKREQAILELGKEEANGELLLQLVNTEKGKCKTAAQKALAQLEYLPAAPQGGKSGTEAHSAGLLPHPQPEKESGKEHHRLPGRRRAVRR